MSQSISDQFEILELIGRGSFGNVRKVVRKMDGKLFVRKEISYISMNPKERSQLIAEFRILRELKHPNIVQYIHHDHIPEDHMVHLYMEYCDGGDLGGIIRKCRNNGEYVPEEIVWSIFTQILLALYRCHYGTESPPVGLNNLFNSNGDPPPSTIDQRNVVIHRDIKPDNVFLLKDNFVKLGDFGLAKMLNHENDFAKTYVGTPYYMSPEVLADKPYDPVCDIWSLGCVIYELCSLHPPFQAKSHVQLQEKIKEGIFSPMPDHYSNKLKKVISACIMVNPQDRPSAYQLLQDTSVKIFRKDLEFKYKEIALREYEKELLNRDQALLRSEEDLNSKLAEELDYQRKAVEQEVEEIRRGYQNEFEFVVEKEVETRFNKLLNSKKLTRANSGGSDHDSEYSHKPKQQHQQSPAMADISMTVSPSPTGNQNILKIKGPRELSFETPLKFRQPLRLINQDLVPETTPIPNKNLKRLQAHIQTPVPIKHSGGNDIIRQAHHARLTNTPIMNTKKMINNNKRGGGLNPGLNDVSPYDDQNRRYGGHVY